MWVEELGCKLRKPNPSVRALIATILIPYTMGVASMESMRGFFFNYFVTTPRETPDQ